MDINEISERTGMGIVAISEGLGLSRGAASQWDEVPPKQVLPLCELLAWKVTPHDLRPDLYPNPADALPAHVAPAAPCKCASTFGEFGEPRSGVERREGDRRQIPDPDFGDFGEPRDGERRQEERRQSASVDESV